MFQNGLPHCDKLFKRYLSPWYPKNDRPKMTRPDMYVISGYEGQPVDLDKLQYLPDDILADTKDQIDKMQQAAIEDFKSITDFDKLDLSVLDTVGKFYDKKKVKELIKASDPKDFSNPYLISVCEFGSTLGGLFDKLDNFGWLYSYPYFHSIILHTETGWGLTVFDWAVKKFSSYGIDDGFAGKFNSAMDSITKEKNKNGS